MQIVIDIPEEYYNFIKNNEDRFSGSRIYDCVLNGTVLPEGHGRLCDIDAALKCMEEVADDKSNIKACAMGFFDWACSKRVVLEADKEVDL